MTSFLSKCLALVLPLVIAGLLSACAVAQRTEEGEQVRIVFVRQIIDVQLLAEIQKRCTGIGEVVGTEGHWYSYLFTNNDDLVYGALNELRNAAADMGANTVFVYQNIDFSTSVTFLGEAYTCGEAA